MWSKTKNALFQMCLPGLSQCGMEEGCAITTRDNCAITELSRDN